MPVYRYRSQSVDIAKLSRSVPGSLVLGSTAPVDLVDITAPTGSKADLDEVMFAMGWAFESTDPTSTPAEQSANQSLSELDVRSAGTLVGRRRAVNFTGATVTDNPGQQRVDVAIGAASFDMRDQIVWDHFMGGNADLDELGWMGWRTFVSGTAAAVTLSTAALSGHPGIVQLVSGTAATGRAVVYLGESASGARITAGSAGNPITCEFLVRWPAAADLLAANLERAEIGLGLEWEADAELSNGIVMRFAPAQGDTSLTLVCSEGATRTVAASGVVPVAGSWYRINLVVTPGGTPSAQMSVNGVAGTAITTNVPDIGLGIGMKASAAGGTASTTQIDYIRLTQVTDKET